MEIDRFRNALEKTIITLDAETTEDGFQAVFSINKSNYARILFPGKMHLSTYPVLISLHQRIGDFVLSPSSEIDFMPESFQDERDFIDCFREQVISAIRELAEGNMMSEGIVQRAETELNRLKETGDCQ